MKRAMGLALRMAALLVAGVFLAASPASGQYVNRLEDLYGMGADGTIGRGTTIVPWGASDPRVQGRTFDFASRSTRYPNYNYYSSGYYSAPAATRPYRTTQTYEPGDGYRYPLYYNPATRSYFYYPVRR